jgi:hypothetical protein
VQDGIQFDKIEGDVRVHCDNRNRFIVTDDEKLTAFLELERVTSEASPRRSANKVDLPAPLGPTNPIRSPRLTWSDTSSKSARLAKDFESWETVSIAESAQCSLVRCPAQPLVAPEVKRRRIVACLPRRLACHAVV